MSEDSMLDIWIKGRFEYAIPALKITLGTLVSIIILNYIDASFLLKEMSFPSPLTYGRILGYLTAAAVLILAMYYAGEFWINLFIWGFKKISKLQTSSRTGSQ